MIKTVLSSLLVASAISSSASAQGRFDDVEIESTHLRGTVHALVGAGGNIGVSAGSDGVLIVDDQFAPLAEKIATALGQLGSDKPRYVINTHYHGDHVGSNAFFAEQKDATILSHHNVRIRLANGEDVNPKSLPVITYDGGVKLHFNEETIHVFHLPNAHTDGDSAVWFENADVLHTGDLFFNGMFPFIDLNGGGSVDGYMAAVQALIDKISDQTVIIAGHGKIANKGDFQTFLAMIKETNAFVDGLKAEGKTVDQIVEQGLPKKWQQWSWNFINEVRWINTLYDS
ncbi:MBL fold metallo-hydrolase [Alteromonas sediminis]|uniref:MBL fold metallo-hydrolase n=2 Tax=Alteromonas sediminis TaxID=2259342 RepID=A0A3N5Y0Y4_9ALTE|nr:MBL fold metallo-hydrolase [Alteromonas sediminis]